MQSATLNAWLAATLQRDAGRRPDSANATGRESSIFVVNIS
jgi:hypothetical protein